MGVELAVLVPRLLVVDRDTDTCTSLQDLLLMAFPGAEVRTARDVTGAWRETQRWVPDVALVDLMLPDQDGLRVAERMCKEHAGLHCILMTASRCVEEHKAPDYVHHVVHKPPDPYALQDAIRHCLRNHVEPHQV